MHTRKRLSGRFQLSALILCSTILIGIGETWQERIDSLLTINELHQQYGHIQEVIVQNFCAKPNTEMASHAEPDLNDMLRTLAVARLLLDPSISLQAPPNLQQRYKDYIGSGINDLRARSDLFRQDRTRLQRGSIPGASTIFLAPNGA